MAKQTVESAVAEMAEPVLTELGLELVDVEFKKEGRDWFLRIFMDKESGIELDDCEKVSRLLDAKLDELDPIDVPYHLEVSSPGLDRPLKKDADFTRFAGRLVNIAAFTNINGKKKFKGELVGLIDGVVKLTLQDGTTVDIPRDKIAKARLEIDM